MPFGLEIPPDLFFFAGLIAIGVVLLRSGGGTWALPKPPRVGDPDVDTLARLAAHLGRPDLTLRLVAAVERALAAHGIVDLPVNRDLRDRWLIPLQKTLSAKDATRWWAEGDALSLDEAVALAQSSPLAAASSPDPWNATTVSGPVPRRQLEAARLTDREAEVLRLVARGQSNKEIAAELVLSVRTVERHITNIYGKIDARGKADAMAYAFKHGLL